MQEAFSVFDRDKSGSARLCPFVMTIHYLLFISTLRAGGRVTPSELKHVMNSLGEKAGCAGVGSAGVTAT